MRFGWLTAALIWMGIIFFLSSIPNLELSGTLSTYDLALRKLAHITEYAILTMLLLKTFTANADRKKYILVACIAIVYACSDELHQSLVPTRDGKIADIIIDSIGIVIGILISRKLHTRHASTNIPN